MLALLVALGALAADADAAEEVIVYGDDFARWDNTRWLVQTELILPFGMTFSSEENNAFSSYAFQVRAILACEKDAKLSRKKWEVSCALEDVGILVTTQRRWRREKDRAMVEDVLAEIDAKMTGLAIQMQVDVKGGITNFDIEGLTTDNQRERGIQEAMRQMVSRVMAGFHLRIPDHAQRSGQWVEYNSELMDLPSLTASRGSTTLVHQVTVRSEMQIVQTVGEGTVSVNIPYVGNDPFSASLLVDDGGGVNTGGQTSGIGGATAISADAPSSDDGGIPTGTGNESDVEAIYAMKATGVAIFDRDTGVMTERVWAAHGFPTASSGGGTLTAPYRNVGRITMLGEADKPDVGPTRQVAWPTRAMDGLEPWVDIETMPDAP